VRSTITLLGCGDVGPIHAPVAPYASLVKPTLATADLRFAQCERVYSRRGSLPHTGGDHHSRLDPDMASIFGECGFDVVSVASNHAMDWGADAMLDTVEVLQRQGIKTAGVGANLTAARTPAIVERKGVTVAFLAYCSVLREGYAAEANRPGVAPLRVRTRYEPAEYQPGMPPRIITEAYAEDLENLLADVRAARDLADVVVLSLHWGLHFIPRTIAGYQPSVAKLAFAAGADLILGHHAHVPKAIAMFDGKACFYSLSNFIMSAPPAKPERREIFADRYGISLDPDYPNLPYGVDAKRSLIAKAELSRDGVSGVSFLPVLIDRQLRPEVLKAGDPRFDDALRYMEWASQGHDHRFVVQGDEFAVHPASAMQGDEIAVHPASAMARASVA
jgi:poly-gamma-glutamate capsule biosynthesis protein CapA/YwtB (metallophosphatase superfamily)